jgi:hypothetical protein
MPSTALKIAYANSHNFRGGDTQSNLTRLWQVYPQLCAARRRLSCDQVGAQAGENMIRERLSVYDGY